MAIPSDSTSSTIESISESEIHAIDLKQSSLGFISKAVEQFKEKEKELVHSFTHSLHHHSLYHHSIHHDSLLQITKEALENASKRMGHQTKATNDSAVEVVSTNEDIPDAGVEPAHAAVHKDLKTFERILHDPETMDQHLEESEELVIKRKKYNYTITIICLHSAGIHKTLITPSFETSSCAIIYNADSP